jgi:hypothetical protein
MGALMGVYFFAVLATFLWSRSKVPILAHSHEVADISSREPPTGLPNTYFKGDYALPVIKIQVIDPVKIIA